MAPICVSPPMLVTRSLKKRCPQDNAALTLAKPEKACPAFGGSRGRPIKAKPAELIDPLNAIGQGLRRQSVGVWTTPGKVKDGRSSFNPCTAAL